MLSTPRVLSRKEGQGKRRGLVGRKEAKEGGPVAYGYHSPSVLE